MYLNRLDSEGGLSPAAHFRQPGWHNRTYSQQTNAMKLVFVPVSEPEEGHGHPDFDLSSHSKASLTMELALYLKATGPSPVRGLEPEH